MKKRKSEREFPTRREFISRVGAAIAGFAVPTLLPACGAGLASYRGTLEREVIAVPKTPQHEDALRAHGVLLVRAEGLPVTLVLRRIASGETVALSTICTHSGCEVRVMPRSFQCPCHGSEYDEQGSVLEGPASEPLQSFVVEETESSYQIKVKL